MAGAPAGWRLEEMGEFLDLLFGQSSLGIAFHDRELRFVYVNQRLAALGRHRPADYPGRTLEEMRPDIAPRVLPPLRQVLETGSPLIALRFRDREMSWLVSYYPVRTRDGELLGVGAVAVDDTERQDTESRLRASEERYRALVETSPDAIVLIEGDRTVFMNRAGFALVRATTPSDILGRDIWQFVAPEDRDRAATQFAEALSARRYRAYEGKFLRVDGTEFIGSVVAAAYDYAGGHGVQAIVRDVTAVRAEMAERERLIAALDVERLKLHTVLRQLPAGVVFLDADGGLVLANEEAERIWGAPLQPHEGPIELWGLGVRTASGKHIPPRQLQLVQALREGTVTSDLGLEITCADGTIRSLRGSAAPVHAVDGTTLGAVATFWDVTELTRAQTDLRRTYDELEARVAERTASLAEANARLRHEAAERAQAERQLRQAERLASIGTFAAGIAHEINNPLAAIMASAELARLLAADQGGDPELNRALERIITQARRGGDIVKGLLRFAREEQTERWPIDVNDVVAHACEFLRHHGLGDACSLRTSFDRRVPAVVMHPTELEQIVINLVHNAVQAGAQDVLLRTHATDGAIRLVIEDDGEGISAEDVERIYDPFFTTRHRDGGTGLGLSIVHGLVMRVGGSIEVQGRVGGGTTFTVVLPANAARDAAATK